MYFLRFSLFSIAASLVAGHAALVRVGSKLGLGVTKTTDLGTGDAIHVSTQSPCGPNVDLSTLSANDAAPLGNDGSLNMSVFQINTDGAGPFNVLIDAGATGEHFNTSADVTTQVPGNNGISNGGGNAFPLNIKLPTSVACTGGSTGNFCLVQVQNPNGFGGCGLIQQGAALRRQAKTAPNRTGSNNKNGDNHKGKGKGKGKGKQKGED
jgi:hypothetical protein